MSAPPADGLAGGAHALRDCHQAPAHPHGHDSAGTPVSPSHHGHRLERWPLRDAISLGALAGAVPSARAHVRQLLWEWGHGEAGDDVGTVVSELVTNAVAASADMRPALAAILVWLGSDTRRILAAVADASPRPPIRLSLGPDAEGGRGLAVVAAMSTRWGWHPATAAGLVKVVWAEWHLPARVPAVPARPGSPASPPA